VIWSAAAALCCVLVLAATAVRLRRRYVEVRVSGTSMTPTYQPGDRALVRRTDAAALRVGDIVVIEKPESDGTWSPDDHAGDRQWVIKRVAALPGDPVPPPVPVNGLGAGRIVPPGKLVVLGDAGRYSFDSKQHGFFPLDRVLGVAVRRRPAPPSASG
jgi:signal peptidase I